MTGKTCSKLHQPLFIFVHQPKNAGNTFNIHLKHNLQSEERLLLAQLKFGLDKHFPTEIKAGLEKFFFFN